MGLADEAGGHLQGRLVPLNAFSPKGQCAQAYLGRGAEGDFVDVAAGGLEAVVGILCSREGSEAKGAGSGRGASSWSWPGVLGCTDKQGSAHRRGGHTHLAVAAPATHPQ